MCGKIVYLAIRRMCNLGCALVLLCCVPGWAGAGEAVVKYIGNNHAIKESYYLALIEAALKKTESDFGPYKIEYSLQTLSSERKHELLVAGEQLNIDRLVGFPSDEGPRQGLLRVDVPLLNGLMGYRILLIRAENQARFSSITSLEELRHLSMGFGKGWEGHVYRHNGFFVVETLHLDMMLKMLAGKRYQFVPLSVIEIDDEYQIAGQAVNYLVPEKSLLIYMPLPVYFYVSPTEPQLAERLTKGLELLRASGEMDQMLKQYFGARLQRLNLSQRKIIELTNPDDDGSHPDKNHNVLNLL